MYICTSIFTIFGVDIYKCLLLVAFCIACWWRSLQTSNFFGVEKPCVSNLKQSEYILNVWSTSRCIQKREWTLTLNIVYIEVNIIEVLQCQNCRTLFITLVKHPTKSRFKILFHFICNWKIIDHWWEFLVESPNKVNYICYFFPQQNFWACRI